jgi:hypothetical protein
VTAMQLTGDQMRVAGAGRPSRLVAGYTGGMNLDAPLPTLMDTVATLDPSSVA